MVTITDRARAQVLALIRDNNLGDVVLRLAMVGGGCGGSSRELSFDAATRDGDKVYDLGNLKICVDRMSRPFVGNTQIDYQETPWGSGFTFADPEAASACGCGQPLTPGESGTVDAAE